VPEEDGEEPEGQERGIPDDYPSEGKFHRTTLDHLCILCEESQAVT
jgi:hypothetical protein